MSPPTPSTPLVQQDPIFQPVGVGRDSIGADTRGAQFRHQSAEEDAFWPSPTAGMG